MGGRVAVPLCSLVLAALLARPARGGDPEPAPAPEPSYAGKPASWWVGELRNPKTESVAAAALRVIGPGAYPALAQALRSSDSRFRSRAARQIAAIPGDAAAILPAIADVLLLGDEEAADPLCQVIDRMDTAARPALPALLRGTEDRRPQVRNAALRGIVAMEPHAPEAASLLARALADDSTRRTAVEGVRRLGPAAAEAASALAALLARPSDGEREIGPRVEVIAALGAIGGSSAAAVAALRKALEDPRAGIRPEVVRALGACAIADPALVADLVRAFDDPDRWVRRAAVGALAASKRTEPEVVAVFARALADAVPDVSTSAAQAIATLGAAARPAIPALLDAALRQPDHGSYAWALRNLGEWTAPALAAWLADESPRARHLATTTLPLLEWRHAAPAAERLLAGLAARLAAPNGEAEERRAVARVLGWAAAGDPRFHPLLVETLVDRDAQVAAAAARQLAARPAARPAPAAAPASPGGAPPPAAAGALAPGPLSAAEAEALLPLLREDDVGARVAAARALATSGAREEVKAMLGAEERRLLARAFADALGQGDPMLGSWLHLAVPLLDDFRPEILVRVVATLGDAREAVVANATLAWQLLANGREAIDLCVAALSSRDPLQRSGAARALSTRRPNPVPLGAVVRDLLSDPRRQVRRNALFAMMGLDSVPADLVGPTLPILRDEDPAVAAMAVQATARLAPHPAALEALADALADARGPVRSVIAGSIAAFGKDAVGILGSRLADPSQRHGCLMALSQIGPEAADAAPALAAALHDAAGGVASDAATVTAVLRRIGPRAASVAPALAEAYAEGPDSLRVAILPALMALAPGSPAAFDLVRAAFAASESPDVRRAAVHAMNEAPAGSEEALDLLLAALSDPDSQVASLAANTLGSRTALLVPRLPVLVEALARDGGHEASERALAAVDSLAAPSVAAALPGASTLVRARLFRVLAWQARTVEGTSAVAAALGTLLGDRAAFWADRLRAVEALARLTRVPGTTAATDSLASAFDDPETEPAAYLVRAAFSSAMLAASGRAERLAPVIDACRASRWPTVRRTVETVRGRAGLSPSARAEMANLLADADAAVRLQAAFGLLGPLAGPDETEPPDEARAWDALPLSPAELPRLYPVLARALAAPDANVRLRAAAKLCEIGAYVSGECHEALARALDDGSPRVVRSAAHALGRSRARGMPWPRDACLAALAHERPLTRAAAAVALALSGDDPAAVVPAAAPLLRDADPIVRALALEALAACGPASAEHAAAIEALQADADPAVAREAARASAEIRRTRGQR